MLRLRKHNNELLVYCVVDSVPVLLGIVKNDGFSAANPHDDSEIWVGNRTCSLATTDAIARIIRHSADFIAEKLEKSEFPG